MKNYILSVEKTVQRSCDPAWRLTEDSQKYTLLFILKGSGDLLFENQRLPLTARQALLFRPRQAFEIQNADMEIQLFVFSCKPQLPAVATPFIALDDFSVFPPQFRRYNSLLLEDSVAATFLRGAVFYELLGEISAQIKQITANPHVVAMKKYIANHLTEKITLPDLAWVTGLSTVYCGAVFKENTGITVSQYMLQQRVKLAETLLMESDLTIRQVAHRSGFEDFVYFSKAFKKLNGQSPLRYRKSHQPLPAAQDL